MADPVGASDLAVAGAALLGAIIGGLGTAGVTHLTEKGKQKFERERDAERAQRDRERELGIARVTALALHPRYVTAAAAFRLARDEKAWWPLVIDPGEAPSLSDRKLLAQYMSGDNVWVLVRGELAVQTMFAPRRPPRRWGKEHTRMFQTAYERAQAAAEALARFGRKEN